MFFFCINIILINQRGCACEVIRIERIRINGNNDI